MLTGNSFGEVIQEVSPDRGTSVYYYDAAGDLSAAIDGRGQRIDYSRDILGRVTAKTPVSRPTSEIVTYTYDSGGVSGCACIGRLASMTDASGTTSFGYDHRGNLTAKVQPIGALSWTYDLADRIVQTRYPSGRDVAYTRDDKGRVTEVKTRPDSGASWTVLASNIAYEPFGPMKSADFGNGLKLSQDWGSDRRLASKRLYTSGSSDVWHVSYSYDGDDNITAITDLVTPANSRSFDYDSVDRLARVDGGTGGFAREDYVHDKNGNLTTVERRVIVTDASPAESDTHARTSGTNRISSVTHPGGTRSFTHDARGNLIADTRPAGAGVTLGYDGHARLASYARAGAETQAMLYNGFDERVGLTTTLGGSPVDERRYAYDANHRIVGEYGATTSDLRAEYIWLLPEVGGASPFGGDDGLGGYMPLAVAVPDGTGRKINWVQGNHLGTPVVTTDASGAVVTPTGYDRIGFPGQVEQHADLYYNYYRDYDPTLGRYVQADPIGLGGDMNPFVYAKGNPMRFADSFGLKGRNYFPRDEPGMREAADKFYEDLPQHMKDNGLHLFGHGGPNRFCIFGDHGKSCKNGQQLAEFLNEQKLLEPERPIYLWSCRAGLLDDSSGLAYSLSYYTRTQVYGADKYVWYGGDGYAGIYGKIPRTNWKNPFDTGRLKIFEEWIK